MSKRCESCGMPLTSDPQGGGTEQDGSRSERYCSLCYANGAFLQNPPDGATFQRETMNAMIANGYWRPLAWVLTRGIPALPRWRNS